MDYVSMVQDPHFPDLVEVRLGRYIGTDNKESVRSCEKGDRAYTRLVRTVWRCCTFGSWWTEPALGPDVGWIALRRPEIAHGVGELVGDS